MTRVPPARTPAVVGFLLGGAVILGVGLAASTFMAVKRPGAPADGVPVLEIVRPAAGDSVRNPVVLQFRTPAELRLSPAGWSAAGLHLHAMVDGREIMPAAADIAVDGAVFLWRLPPLRPGAQQVYLSWAAADHVNLAGVTDTLLLHVLP